MRTETGSVHLASALVAPAGAASDQAGVPEDNGFAAVFAQPLPLSMTEVSLKPREDTPAEPWAFWSALSSSFGTIPRPTSAETGLLTAPATGQTAVTSPSPVEQGVPAGTDAPLGRPVPASDPQPEAWGFQSAAAVPVPAPEGILVEAAPRSGVPGPDQRAPMPGVTAAPNPPGAALAGKADIAGSPEGGPVGKKGGQAAGPIPDPPEEPNAASVPNRTGLPVDGTLAPTGVAPVMTRPRSAGVTVDPSAPSDLPRLKQQAGLNPEPAELASPRSAEAAADENRGVPLTSRFDRAASVPAQAPSGAEAGEAAAAVRSEPTPPTRPAGQSGPEFAIAAPAPPVRPAATPVAKTEAPVEASPAPHPSRSPLTTVFPSMPDPSPVILPRMPELPVDPAHTPPGTEAERLWLGLVQRHDSVLAEAGRQRDAVVVATPADQAAAPSLYVPAAKPAGSASSTQAGPALSVPEQAEPFIQPDSDLAPFAWSPGSQLLATGSPLAAPLPPSAGPQILAGIAASLLQRADGVTEISLSPDELGGVRLRLEADARDPERMIIHLAFDRSDTMDLFRRHADQLTDAIRAAGYAEARLDFGQHGTGSEAGGGQRGPDAGTLPGTAPAADEADKLSRQPAPDQRFPLRLADMAGLDLRL